MKIIQQDEKVIAYIEKDDTNERKIIESVQENGVTDFEVDSENPMLYSEDGLLYGKKKTMPNGETRLIDTISQDLECQQQATLEILMCLSLEAIH